MGNKILKRSTILLLFFTASLQVANAQEVGLSFSYFLPKNGHFSIPISPFSLRGIGLDLNKYMAVQTGFSLYRMSGLNVKGFDGFESRDPIIGPNFTVIVPVEFVLQYIGKRQQFRLKGGAFGLKTFDNKLNYGNLDKAIRAYKGWEVANSSFDYENKFGWGYLFGAEYIAYVTRQWGLSLEVNYFIGDADLELEGYYTGGNMSGPLTTEEVSYPDSKIDFTGLEISIGILITR